MAIRVNGHNVDVPSDPRISLLGLLHEQLGLTGTKPFDNGLSLVRRVDVSDRHVRALIGERLRYRGTNSTGFSGHQGNVAPELMHDLCPSELSVPALKPPSGFRNWRYDNGHYDIRTMGVKVTIMVVTEIMEGVILGRHREFDMDEVLDAAVRIFWQKGYESTTYADLVKATGVERPALYSAFGNKEALFLKALARYDKLYLDYMPEALALPTAHEVATHIIHQAIDLNTRFPEHTGCLGINGGLAVSDAAEPVRRALNEYRLAGQDRLRERFVQAKAEGDLPETADPLALAAFVTTVTQGIAVQAKAGLDRATLELVADEALACWHFRFSPSPEAERH